MSDAIEPVKRVVTALASVEGLSPVDRRRRERDPRDQRDEQSQRHARERAEAVDDGEHHAVDVRI